MRLRILLAMLLVQAVFLLGLLRVHLSFSLPHAELETIDVLTEPGNECEIRCLARLVPPGSGTARREGLPLRFFELTVEIDRETGAQRSARSIVGTAVSDPQGLASLSLTAPEALGVTRLLYVDFPADWSVVLPIARPWPHVLMQTISRGTSLILCDVEVTLREGYAWRDIPLDAPTSWPCDEAAARGLSPLSRGIEQVVVYLAPGDVQRMSSVRAYLYHFHFPSGTVFFPASPLHGTGPADFLQGFKEHWPRIKCGITRNAAFARLLTARGIAVVSVGAGPLPDAQSVPMWTDVSSVVKSL